MRRPSTRAMLAVVVGLVLGLGAGVGGTQGAFSSVTGNAGNSFSAAAAPPVACAQTLSLAADSDSYVRSNVPDTNNGNNTTMDVWPDPADLARSFLAFPLPALGAGCMVLAASMTVNVKVGDGHNLKASRVTSAWTEMTITWNNQPPIGGAPATAKSLVPSATFSVLSQVQAMYVSGDYGFAIIDAQEGTPGGITTLYTYHGASGADSPILTVTYG